MLNLIHTGESTMFTKIAPNTDAAKALEETLVEASGRTNYNDMVREFNSLEANGFLQFPWDREKASTIHQQMDARGLARDADYTLSFANVGGKKDEKTGAVEGGVVNAYLKRVSDKVGTLVTPAKRGPRTAKVAEAATAAPVSTPAAPAAAPAKSAQAATPAKPSK